MLTQAHRRDTPHTVCQGLRTGTGHTGVRIRWVVSRDTYGYNTDKGVLPKPAGLQRGIRCSAPSPLRGSTGRNGVGVARPAQQVVERVHALPRAKHGELQDCVEGVIFGGSARGVNSIGCGVDGGVASGVGSANESYWD